MKILIIGSGGREHALAWKCSESAQVETVYVAPGNAGTATEAKLQNVDISATDLNQLVRFAKENTIDLTIIGPEAPLVAGIVDLFNQNGLKCFGPSAYAAQLEGSKAFCKQFLEENDIPTARYGKFDDTDSAKKFADELGYPLVVKADGLAAGKGVIIAENQAEAFAAIDGMLLEGQFGDASQSIVVEAFLQGEEASFIAICDGKTVLPFATSQDHKARDNGDKGPNTGGMGAYSPAPVITREIHDRVMKEVMQPTVDALRQNGTPYVGFLYAGLMIANDGTPNVLEFNCRFGDPETQPIMMRLKSDLPALILAACEQELHHTELEWDSFHALGVVMAAGGYPNQYDKGMEITDSGTDDASQKVFHAGTALDADKRLVTSGGRVLCVTALGETLQAAQSTAYDRVKQIQFDKAYYRDDIGWKGLS